MFGLRIARGKTMGMRNKGEAAVLKTTNEKAW